MNPQISPQYITKDKITVTILDMINPAHFVVKESADLMKPFSEAKEFLEAEDAMQKFYASIEACFFQLPLKDSIVVVLYKEKFYRAKVIRILTMSAGHLFKVYLVDYGIECSVPRESIFEIEKDFLHHPFQAVNVKLLGIEPVSLIMNQIDLTMSYGPVSDWDQSAAIYIKDLQKNMCSAYIEVQGLDSLHLYGKLYFCFESIPAKCINDDLISKSFAHFNEDCWKSIHTLESFLDGSYLNADVAVDQFQQSENVKLDQVPCADNLSESELDDIDFKTMFINPVDGKIIAESTLTKDRKELLLKMDGESQLQEETLQVKQLHNPENKSSSNCVENSPETELLAEKHFQKLLNKKKRLSSSLNTSTDDASCKKLQTANMNKTETHTIPCENSYNNSYSNEENSQNSTHRTIKSSVNEAKSEFENSFAGEIDCTIHNQNIQTNEISDNHRTLNQNESSKSCETAVSLLSSSKSNLLKEETSKSEEETASENTTQEELISQKRFMKLQQLVAKRKSLSPIKPKSMDSDLEKTSPSVAKKNILDDSFKDAEETLKHMAAPTINEERNISINKIEVNQNRPSQPSDETVQNPDEKFSKQEGDSMTMSERQLQRLQNKVRLKQKKDSLQANKPSSGPDQYKEISVNTSFDSSLDDSDSGLNSYSSSPSISDRIMHSGEKLRNISKLIEITMRSHQDAGTGSPNRDCPGQFGLYGIFLLLIVSILVAVLFSYS